MIDLENLEKLEGAIKNSIDNEEKLSISIENAKRTVEILEENAMSPEAGEDVTNIYKEIDDLNKQIEEWQEQLNLLDKLAERADKLKVQIANAERTVEILEENAISPEAGEDVTNIYKEIDDLNKQIEDWKKDLTTIEKLLEYADKYRKEKAQTKSEKGSSKKEPITSEKGAKGKKVYDWHPELTEEQKDELIAEGLEPGDPEYFLALRNYGIKDNGPFHYQPEDDLEENKKQGKKVYDWHPELTEEQKDELIAEGLEPGDPEYFLALRNYGIKDDGPFHYEDEPGKGEDPDPKKKKGKGKDEDPDPDPTKKKGNNNLPIRSFWEIYDQTCTQHAGSIATALHGMANMQVWPWGRNKDENVVKKILLTGISPVSLILKYGAKIPNAILGTNRKFREMQENIDNLSPEEFSVLVRKPEVANIRHQAHIKENFDKDYLSPQTMKSGKINNLYLSAVQSRLDRENSGLVKDCNTIIAHADSRISELQKIGRENWTSEQESEFNQLVISKQAYADLGKEARDELHTFADGAKKKSSGFRNISGWFLAKFNPDNREQNHQMAEFSRARNEAARIGDTTTVQMLTEQMEQFMKDNTDIRGTERSHIDIGKYSVEAPVEALDKGEQTNGRLLLSNFAMVASLRGLYEQFKNAKINQELLTAHNKHLEKVNDANKDIKVQGTVPVSDVEGAEQAQEAMARVLVRDGFNRGERADMDIGMNGNNSQHMQHHLDTNATASAVEQHLANGDSTSALKEAIKFNTDVSNRATPIIDNYMKTNTTWGQTLYGGEQIASGVDLKMIENFFVNGAVPYSTNVSGVMANMMEQLKSGIDPTAVILSGANLLYQAQREGKNNLRHNIRVDETQTQQEENQNERTQQEENQQEGTDR